MRLFLVRHGQTAWNSATRAQGHTDVPLDSEGERQALSLHRYFAEHLLDKVYTSDLQRSLETARQISDGAAAELVIDPLLRERSFGSWEGLSFEQVRANFDREGSCGNAHDVCPPGGESLLDAWHRAGTFWDKFQPSFERDTVIVSHGGTCALLLAKALAAPLESAIRFRFANASCTLLEQSKAGPLHLKTYNDTSHLGESALVGDVHGSYR